ncbi:hypothetical protein [Reichenbachiella ulvae]|uniref:Uncharacterized protein n=1 Tax=Reichenbachiella ulvae TaxID=2980104 RepID=A0ABT3CUC4_9BACT|nr:hypothetical protein [Reichenbachiella ulvae]MCV9387297.1 hypothetical protein [Reichenbachiella ulvae]
MKFLIIIIFTLYNYTCFSQSLLEQLFIDLPLDDQFFKKLDANSRRTLIGSKKMYMNLPNYEVLPLDESVEQRLEENHITYFIIKFNPEEKYMEFAAHTFSIDDIKYYSMSYWTLSNDTILIGITIQEHHDKESELIEFYIKNKDEYSKVKNNQYLPNIKSFDNIINLHYVNERGVSFKDKMNVLNEIMIDQFSFQTDNQSIRYSYYLHPDLEIYKKNKGYIESIEPYLYKIIDLEWKNDKFEIVKKY